MIHIQNDPSDPERKGRFACGLDALPPGDKWFGCYEFIADLKADCPGCNPTPRQLGTPLSQLSGRPGEPGFAEFSRIASSWGYE